MSKQNKNKENQNNEKDQAELNDLQEKVATLDNQLKRAVADYQNLEKRISDGRLELSTWATANFITKMLPILDHFEKAIKGANEEEKKSGWFRGVELALQQLRGMLKDEGLEEIVADGQFDPALHEAVDIQQGEDNMILETTEKGYTLNGKILKPAKVVVGKKG